MSPKMIRNATTNQLVDAYLQGNFRKESPNHCYPTRTKVARAASTVQHIEETQTKEHSYPIFNFDQCDVNNPPNELKHKDLIKSNICHMVSMMLREIIPYILSQNPKYLVAKK